MSWQNVTEKICVGREENVLVKHSMTAVTTKHQRSRKCHVTKRTFRKQRQ